MTKNIILTYDPTPETFWRFSGIVNQNSFWGRSKIESVKSRVEVDFSLYKALQDTGAEVKILGYSKLEDPDMNTIREQLSEADLIFHNAGMVAYDTLDNDLEERCKVAIDNLVHDEFLDKSHYISPRHLYHQKGLAIDVARNAGVPTPTPLEFDDVPEVISDLPIVLKNPLGTCGEGIYPITRPDQLHRIFYPEKYFETMSQTGQVHNFRIEEYVECPGDRFATYRIVTIGDGSIVGAVLNVSGHRKSENKHQDLYVPGVVYSDDLLGTSAVQMSFRDIRSNYTQGGFQIPLNRNQDSVEITSEMQEVLQDHGLDITNPTLPRRLEQNARRLAIEFSKRGIIIGGQDYIDNGRNQEVFLEINPSPSVELYNTLFNRGNGDIQSGTRLGFPLIANRIANYNT